MITYEQQLTANPMWALQEGSMHFERESAVFKTLTKIARRLDELNIPYAIAGGMAMFLHGYRRFTEVVDVIVAKEYLQTIHDELEGRGYLPVFTGSKNLRDTEHGVRIEFLIAGQYPGDGLPKSVAFPRPDNVAVDIEGIQCVSLDKLIELKLASGTAKGRRKDLGDVQEMIRALKLGEEFAERLDESVRELYREIWAELSSDDALDQD